MKKLLIGLVLLSYLPAFGADLETLRTARSALFSRAELTVEQANTLHRLGLKILEIEGNRLGSGLPSESKTSNLLEIEVQKARSAVHSFIRNVDQDRDMNDIEALNRLIEDKISAEDNLIDSLRADGF